jgi:hypothetical protein
LAAALISRVGWAAVDPASGGAAPGLPEVTVIAPKPPQPNQIAGKNLQTFIRSHGKPGKRTGQLGRWNSAICVSTRGLSEGFNDFVSARVQAIASAVAVHLAQAAQNCTPDVLVIFTTEPQKLMDDVAKRHPELLGFHYISEVPKLKVVDRPVQAWYVTATRGSSGVFVVDDIWSTMPSGSVGSRIYNGLSSYIVFALVVVDTNKVTGYPIGPISDYIAMLSLSQTRLIDGCGELPSILDLMAPACSGKSDSITAGDIAYLRALYTIYLDQDVRQQRSSIEAAMRSEFARR